MCKQYELSGSSAEIESQSTWLSRTIHAARKDECTYSTMAENLKIKVPLACPHYAISTFMMITSVVALLGTLAMKYEFSMLFGNYLEDYMGIPVLFLIAGSVVVFINACLGLVSLAQRWYHGMITFIVCTVLLLVAMIVLIVVAYMFCDNPGPTIFKRLLEEHMNNQTLNSEVIDAVQSRLQCCGYINFYDWTNASSTIPQSCCIIDDAPCDTNNLTEIHPIGCWEALQTFVHLRKWLIAVVLGVLGIIEIISIFLSVIALRDMSHAITTTAIEVSAVDNEDIANNALPRIHNPLGQNSLPSVNNGNRTQEPYVRRPSEVPAVLTYRSPHESFLRQPPQLRFDRRIILANHKNPYASRPG